MNRPPVIILGMHRSGTTLLVKVLKDLGLFVGAKLGRNEEPVYFQAMNEWLLRRCGGAWDHPMPVKRIYEYEDIRKNTVNMLRESVNSSRFSEFIGPFRRKGRLKGSWGWKDPRTIFTVKLWLEVFPGASILYIKRNGIDVAQSLTVRARERRDSPVKDVLSVMPLWWRLRNAFREHEQFVKISLRCRSLDESFRLWEEYSTEAEQFFDDFEGSKLSFRYEDFLQDPRSNIAPMLSLCGLSPSERDIDSALRRIDKQRAYSFARDEELVEFFKRVCNSDMMKKMDYDSIKW